MAVSAVSPKAGSEALVTEGSRVMPLGAMRTEIIALPEIFFFQNFGGYSGMGPTKGLGAARSTDAMRFLTMRSSAASR